MKTVIEMIENFINGEMDALKFSFALPDLLIEEYDSMKAQNEDATNILNEELPEICAEYEPGMDENIFRGKVIEEYKKAKEKMK